MATYTSLSAGNTLTISTQIDSSASIPAFKYPNGAMLGYMIRTMYPSSITTAADKWLYINHVPDTLDFSTGLSTGANIRNVDVGMNGTSNSTTISAGDYLNYIQVNNKWEKLGSLRAWISAEDAESSSTENLITGFYLFNPQEYSIQIDYILIN